MNQVWGRRENTRWPSSRPVYTITALVIALASGFVITYHRYTEVWTPLERLYLMQYLRSGVMARLGVKADRYQLLNVANRKASRLALDDEVVPVTTASGEITFALTQEAVKAGAVQVEWEGAQYYSAELHAFLGHWIYHDQTPMDLATWPLRVGLGVLLVGLAFALPQDAARARELRYGRRLKGPELVTVGAFNRRNRSQGTGFANLERSLTDKVLGKNQMVRVPRRRESSHFLIMGDRGGGKSTLIRQILIQIKQRGETAIVYDPQREYTPQFYWSERGDVILNPLDARMPYWNPANEARNEPEALTLAASLFPNQDNTKGPREIFAHLLTYGPTPDELAWWMSHEEEVDRRVKGTEIASAIAVTAPGQREGVMAELKRVAKALKLLPGEEEAKRRWSTLEWSKERKGWLFLTNTKTTRERLLPLTSLWIDLLVLRLMEEGMGNYAHAGPRPVWFVLDELAWLQKLPQLHAAVTQGRKSNNPVVLGFEGRSQLEALYGDEAEAMLSQPATKIFLRTGEPGGAKWISETIGEVEIEQLHKSPRSGDFPHDPRSKNYQVERRVEPLVTASEITRLGEQRGYFKSGNLVVRLSFPYIDLPATQPGLIPRAMDWQVNKERSRPVTEHADDGGAGQQLLPYEQKQNQHQQVKRAAPHGQSPFFE